VNLANEWTDAQKYYHEDGEFNIDCAEDEAYDAYKKL
jgi:hypothetical protein